MLTTAVAVGAAWCGACLRRNYEVEAFLRWHEHNLTGTPHLEYVVIHLWPGSQREITIEELGGEEWMRNRSRWERCWKWPRLIRVVVICEDQHLSSDQWREAVSRLSRLQVEQMIISANVVAAQDVASISGLPLSELSIDSEVVPVEVLGELEKFPRLCWIDIQPATFPRSAVERLKRSRKWTYFNVEESRVTSHAE